MTKETEYVRITKAEDRGGALPETKLSPVEELKKQIMFLRHDIKILGGELSKISTDQHNIFCMLVNNKADTETLKGKYEQCEQARQQCYKKLANAETKLEQLEQLKIQDVA